MHSELNIFLKFQARHDSTLGNCVDVIIFSPIYQNIKRRSRRTDKLCLLISNQNVQISIIRQFDDRCQYTIMGLTDSNSNGKDNVQEKYKLIRRYTSDCYGDLTVIQNKQSKKFYALKQLITEDSLFVEWIQSRKNYKQRSLVSMTDYWFCGEQSICSNIRKIQMVFEYYGGNLEEQVKRRLEVNQVFADFEILQILTETIECLKYLDEMNSLHLIGSMKTILYDPQSKSMKLLQNQEMLLYSHRNNKKKQLNIISLLGNKKALPLHPRNEPKDVCDVCLSGEKVQHQNLFAIGLICIGLCWMKDPLELGIYAKGGYVFEKIQKRVHQIKNKYPSVYNVLSSYLGRNKKYENFSYSQVLNEAYAQKRSFSKENSRSQKLIEIQPVEKIGQKRAKKLSYLREMRLSNNDIPNQF